MNQLKIIRNFTRSKIEVLLLKDFYPIGLEGQVIKVKPGFAQQKLYPSKIGVFNFPCLREKVFPNINENQIEKRLQDLKYIEQFEKKIVDAEIDIMRYASFINPNLTKETVDKKDIQKELAEKLGIETSLENIQFDMIINEFGQANIQIQNLYNKITRQKYTFPLKVNIKKQQLTEKQLEELNVDFDNLSKKKRRGSQQNKDQQNKDQQEKAQQEQPQ